MRAVCWPAVCSADRPGHGAPATALEPAAFAHWDGTTLVLSVLGTPAAKRDAIGKVKDALTMARFRRRPVAGLIFHSDRSSQYCSHEFQNALKGWGMRSSKGRKGNCWDNAPTESFWGRFKTAPLYGKKFTPRWEAMDTVLDCMAFYNHRRLHSTLGYLSPMQFEQRWHAA